ncbi:hypothetical protein K7432_010101 [Basidiobolus ranarum]|uniref:Autophagy-related protein 27 n=1 Tax=Basidiobolus ranarum TaxID=34480 RepID=A0ABR2WPF9_9FUNG
MRIIPLLSTLAVILIGCHTVVALDCKKISVKEKYYDISLLDSVTTIAQNETTDPTITQVTYRINPCAPLEPTKDKERDQCVKGTQVCHTTTNFKDDEPRITRVINLAGGANVSEPLFTLESSENENGNLIWSLPGSEGHSTNITFICDKKADGEKPSVKSYEQGILLLEWKSPHACSITDPSKSKPEEPKKEESSKSGWSIFFTVIFCLLFLYFVVGLIYNYLVNHETGIYLIPHLHFWRSFIEVAKDLGYQLYNKCMGIGRGGHGYSAV